MGRDIRFSIFREGESVTTPLQPLLAYLEKFSIDGVSYFESHRGVGLSLPFCNDVGVLVDDAGNAKEIFLTHIFGHPKFNDFAFGLMDQFGYWLLSGGIDTIYHVHGSISDLPQSVTETAFCYPEVVASPDDIWPGPAPVRHVRPLAVKPAVVWQEPDRTWVFAQWVSEKWRKIKRDRLFLFCIAAAIISLLLLAL